jgi:hypothetical protein
LRAQRTGFTTKIRWGKLSWGSFLRRRTNAAELLIKNSLMIQGLAIARTNNLYKLALILLISIKKTTNLVIEFIELIIIDLIEVLVGWE